MVPRPVLLGGALVILALVLVYVLMSDKDSEQVVDAPDPPVTEAPGSSAAKAPDSPAAGATPQQPQTSTGSTAGAAPTTAEDPDSTVAKAPDSPVAGVTPQQSPASTGGTTGAAPATPEAPDSTVAGATPQQSPASTDGTTRDAPAASDAAAPVQAAGVSAADRSADGQPAEPETAAAPLPDRDQAAQDQAAQDQAARDQAAVDDAARDAASGTPAQDTGADSRTPAQTTSTTPQNGDRPASSGVVLPVVRSAASDPASSGPEKPRSSGDTETAASPAAHRQRVSEMRQELRQVQKQISAASRVCPGDQVGGAMAIFQEMRHEADIMAYVWERDRRTDFDAPVSNLDSADLARMEADLSMLLESAAEALEDMENLCLR